VLYVGTSGYAYSEWKGEGLLYPPKLKKDDFLNYYASRFNSLESEQTFYGIPKEATIEKWLAAFPDGFKVSPKLLQSVTHFARLKAASIPKVEAFVRDLEPIEKVVKLGPILIQLPPDLSRNDELIDTFLAGIPHREALLWAVEFRNESWHTPEVEAILRRHNVAWAMVETDEAQAQIRDTARHVYSRLRKLAYSDEELRKWAAHFGRISGAGRDAFIYCRHKDVPRPWDWADRIRELQQTQ